MKKTTVTLDGKTILVTGSPGFVGANLVLRLLKELSSGTIISLDNMNDYYDPALKEYRLQQIAAAAANAPAKHIFIRGSIADKALIERVFTEYQPSIVVNLAAQAQAVQTAAGTQAAQAQAVQTAAGTQAAQAQAVQTASGAQAQMQEME